MIEILILAVVLLIAGFGMFDHKRNPRIRMVEWNKRQSYIRIFPNPGFQVGSKHWCRAKGRRGH